MELENKEQEIKALLGKYVEQLGVPQKVVELDCGLNDVENGP